MKRFPSACILLLLPLCACRPTPPPTERPPEPQAAQVNDELRQAIQAPIEKAKAVQDTQDRAKDRQDAAIDAAVR